MKFSSNIGAMLSSMCWWNCLQICCKYLDGTKLLQQKGMKRTLSKFCNSLFFNLSLELANLKTLFSFKLICMKFIFIFLLLLLLLLLLLWLLSLYVKFMFGKSYINCWNEHKFTYIHKHIPVLAFTHKQTKASIFFYKLKNERKSA